MHWVFTNRAQDKIVDIEKCHLQADPSNAIRNEIRRYAIEKELTFFTRASKVILRTLMIRIPLPVR